MNPPTELPFIRLLWMVTAGMVGLLVLLFLCTPMETHRRNWEGLKQGVRELIGPRALFLKRNTGICLGLFLLGRICVDLESKDR